MNLDIRAQARAVHDAKERKKEVDKMKSMETSQKNAAQIEKRADAYTKTVTALRNNADPIKEVLTKLRGDILKLTYQHIGGVVSKLPNTKKETFIGALGNHESINTIDRSDRSVIKPVDNPSVVDSSEIDELMVCEV